MLGPWLLCFVGGDCYLCVLDLAKQVREGQLKIQVGKVFKLDEIVEAHRMMEDNLAGGKIVVLT